MVRTDGRWRYFPTEASMKEAANKPTFFRVQKTNWTGPGWYYVTTYEQRCPRNCCYDNVIEFTSADDRAAEVAEQMRVLANEIREARRHGPGVKHEPEHQPG